MFGISFVNKILNGPTSFRLNTSPQAWEEVFSSNVVLPFRHGIRKLFPAINAGCSFDIGDGNSTLYFESLRCILMVLLSILSEASLLLAKNKKMIILILDGPLKHSIAVYFHSSIPNTTKIALNRGESCWNDLSSFDFIFSLSLAPTLFEILCNIILSSS